MHKLKDKLMEALYEYEERAARNADGKISDSEIQKIHIITDTVKNIDKIEMLESGEEDMGESRGYGSSYARGGRGGRGSSARRDSMGRYAYGDGGSYRGSSYRNSYYYDGYSREDGKAEMTRKLRDMISDAQTEEERAAIRHCINAIEEM